MKGLLVCVALVLMACGETQQDRQLRRASEQRDALYPAAPKVTCAPGARTGTAGSDDTRRTAQRVRYSVVTPRNYDATHAHPLLVVYAPAKSSGFEVERVTGFTASATAAGFIVVYADHSPLGLATTRDLGGIAASVAAVWCVDEARVFLAGHSDGGTVSHILAVLPGVAPRVAGIAPSGAGVRAADLSVYACPRPTAVMISHGAEDNYFPGWGAETARWWAACNGCSEVSVKDAQGCQAYKGCAAPTRFCQTPGGHTRWPGNAESVVAYFGARHENASDKQ